MAAAPGVPPQGYRAGNPDEWRLRAITDLYEPGSTFKLVTFMGALQEGKITPEHAVRGAVHLQQVRPHDRGRALRTGIEHWTAREILAHSSNVGTITIADKRLGETLLRKWIHLVGIGKQTGVDLPGERKGVLLDDDKWYGTAILNVPIGEGIAVTPLQMAALYGSVANGGKWIQPHVTAAIGGKPDHQLEEAPARHAARRQGAARHAHRRRRLRHGQCRRASRATASPARRARRPSSTPRRAATATPTWASASTRRRSSASRPAKHPRFVALVMVDEPQARTATSSMLEGGTVAAPAFKRIAQGILQVLHVPTADRPRELGH